MLDKYQLAVSSSQKNNINVVSSEQFIIKQIEINERLIVSQET
jgi:hypothetical protein